MFDDAVFDDPPGAALPPDAADTADAAAPPPAPTDLETMRARMEAEYAAKLRAVEARHAAERTRDAAKDAGPLLAATKALLAGDDSDASEGEDVFGAAAPPPAAAKAVKAARAVPSHRRYPHYQVDMCLVDHARGQGDWERAAIAARRVLRAAERYATDAKPPDALADVTQRVRSLGLDRSELAPFEAALANGDFELAAVLGDSALELARRLAPPEPEPEPDDDVWV